MNVLILVVEQKGGGIIGERKWVGMGTRIEASKEGKKNTDSGFRRR